MSVSGVISGGSLKMICPVSSAVVTAVILASSCVCSSVLALFEKRGTMNSGHEISSLCR